MRGHVPKNDLLTLAAGAGIQTVQPGAIVNNKQLAAVLEQVKARQAAYPARQQRGHVARRRPPNNLEGAGSAVEGPGTTSRCCRGSGLRHPLPDLADADVVLTAVKTASRPPSAVALASLGPVLTATARDCPHKARVGTEKRRLDRTKKRQPEARSIAKQHKADHYTKFVGAASNGGVISTLRAG